MATFFDLTIFQLHCIEADKTFFSGRFTTFRHAADIVPNGLDLPIQSFLRYFRQVISQLATVIEI